MYIRSYKEGTKATISNIFGILIEFRTLFHLRKKSTPPPDLQWAKGLAVPPLVKEIIALGPQEDSHDKTL